MALRYSSALVGGVLTLLALAGAPVRAEAKPYAVRIESQPSGATVYLDSKEGDPLGQTPYTGKIPSGAHTLIVELDGYVSQVQDIVIKRRRRVQRFSVELSKIDLASVVVSGPKDRRAAAKVKGARILVDGKEAGRVPATIAVPAGPHQVEVVKDGFRTFETWIEAAEGEKLVVAAELAPLGGARAAGKRDAPLEEDPDVAAEEEARLAAAEAEALKRTSRTQAAVEREKKPAEPTGRQVPFFGVGVGVELGGRVYRPDAEGEAGLRNYDAGAIPMIRLSGEVNPLAFSPRKLVSGWGLYASYARAMPLDSTATLTDGNQVDVPTTWSELDLGLRYRYRFDSSSFVGVAGGYGAHSFTFDFSDQTGELEAEVPDVDYRFWRVGLEGRYGFGRAALLASGGTRLVNSIGSLGDRFAQTDVVALHATLGLAVTLTEAFEVRLSGRYDRYAHEYTAQDGGESTSGLDQFFGGVLSALFVY
jgi:PEGA domain